LNRDLIEVILLETELYCSLPTLNTGLYAVFPPGRELQCNLPTKNRGFTEAFPLKQGFTATSNLVQGPIAAFLFGTELYCNLSAGNIAILPPSYIWNKVLGQLRNRVLYYAHYQEYKKNLLTKTGLFWSCPLRIKSTAFSHL
jgi:hypothetical protein